MIDLKYARQNLNEVKTALQKKQFDPSILEEVLKLEEKKKKIQVQLEDIKAQKNKASKEIPNLTGEEKVQVLTKMKELSAKEKPLNENLQEIEKEFSQKATLIPNPPHQSVPEGKSDEDNKPERNEGTIPEFTFEPKDHLEIGKKLDIIEMEAAANCSGSRFGYLKGDAVLLEFALIDFIIKKLIKKGFTPIIPPTLVKEEAMNGTGFFPADKNEIYHVNPEEDDLYLVGTAEVPLAMLHANQIIEEEKLPIRYIGFSTCYRREAGSYGKDTSGIFRVHQFDKLEMFSFCHPDKSQEEHELIREIEEEILSDLKIPYQVINICGGDLGTPAIKKYDLEAYIPSQKKHRELTSCSNCTDFQSRRLNIRYNNKEGNKLIHTLNGTACAVGRTLIAILENYQKEDGTIQIPKVLQGYIGKDTIS